MALPEIWAFGLRNPWRFSFDPLNGALIIGDVGQGAWEEIDYQPPGRGGLNYGWRNYEGSHVYDDSVAPAYGPLTFPIVEYDHSTADRSPAGSSVRATSFVHYTRDRYFYADSSDGKVWSVHLTTDPSGNVTASDRLEHTAELSGGGLSVGNVSSFAIAGQDNNLYMVLYDSGTIVRVQAGAGQTLRYGTHYTRSDRSDLAVYRPGSGEWFISGVGTTVWGLRGDIPVWVPPGTASIASPCSGRPPARGTSPISRPLPGALQATFLSPDATALVFRAASRCSDPRPARGT